MKQCTLRRFLSYLKGGCDDCMSANLTCFVPPPPFNCQGVTKKTMPLDIFQLVAIVGFVLVTSESAFAQERENCPTTNACSNHGTCDDAGSGSGNDDDYIYKGNGYSPHFPSIVTHSTRAWGYRASHHMVRRTPISALLIPHPTTSAIYSVLT